MVFYWILDFLISYIHDSELQAITEPSLITTVLAKSLPACYVVTSRSLATASNSVNSSALRAQVLSERQLPSDCISFSQTHVQN
jgi:hypothetical protein